MSESNLNQEPWPRFVVRYIPRLSVLLGPDRESPDGSERKDEFSPFTGIPAANMFIKENLPSAYPSGTGPSWINRASNGEMIVLFSDTCIVGVRLR